MLHVLVRGSRDEQHHRSTTQQRDDGRLDAECALDHRNAYELVVATILSAQCTDERVNELTRTVEHLSADARPDVVLAEVVGP